jgi:hypothetical protein
LSVHSGDWVGEGVGKIGVGMSVRVGEGLGGIGVGMSVRVGEGMGGMGVGVGEELVRASIGADVGESLVEMGVGVDVGEGLDGIGVAVPVPPHPTMKHMTINSQMVMWQYTRFMVILHSSGTRVIVGSQ